MKYDAMRKGIFIKRPNRFIAHVDVQEENGITEEICHVKNTGRCKELLIPGVTVYVQSHDNPSRKTKYSLISVMKGNTLINMDSQAPNKVVEEWLLAGNFLPNLTYLKREQRYKNSRFDFYAEYDGKKAFIEVKGVTLEENHIARFPDAPTERGVKHINELIECRKDGYEAFIIFVIQMKGIQFFEPNDNTHKAFGDTLRIAADKGVHVVAYDCNVTKDSLTIDSAIPVCL